MLKKPASVVLASLRGLNVRPGKTPALAGDGWAGANSIRFASSLAAALLDGFFEHPAWLISVIPMSKMSFLAA